ncbi:MAG TPA: glycoside-pentoside-hexuronide (GPH):cation symporter [Rhizomicrobium sp.]|jgi:GPH family glycoside/pentoside/hexuronide:cation symporter
MSEARPHKLTTIGKLSFTVGDYACNLYWQSVSIFLLFFYTDTVGLSAATAGLIYMIASIVDAILDPIMGSIADRTRTRNGRYRPYILFGAVPLGLSFVLLYWKPPLEGLLLAFWMMMSHIVFRFAYTALSIPYTSLNARLTDHSEERSTMAGMRMVFGTLAALTISYFTLPLVTAFGRGDAAIGYTWAAAAFAIVATAIFPLVYLCTKEPMDEQDGEATTASAYQLYWRGTLANKAFWVLVLATCTAWICSTAVGKSILYYFKYYLHAEGSARYALAAMSLAGLVIVPAWVWVTKFIGKRNAWFAASGWGLVMLTIFGLTDIRVPGLMIAWLISMNICSLGLAFTFWSMLPDTVEYGEWASGIRTESFIFGLGQFFLKVALGIGAGLFGVLLGFVGYVPNVEQSAQTLAGMKSLMVGLPAFGLAGAFLAMTLYPMRKGGHETIIDQLAARRNAEPQTLNPDVAT